MSEWLAYWHLEHLGGPEERSDLRMGILAATLANVHRDDAHKPVPFVPDDFLPRFEDPDDETDSASRLSPELFSAMLHARFPLAG